MQPRRETNMRPTSGTGAPSRQLQEKISRTRLVMPVS